MNARLYSLTLEGDARSLQLSADRTILDSCLDLGLPVPYNCRSGECGECVARLSSGHVQELPGADPATYTSAMRDAGMILTCMCYPASDLHISVPLRSREMPAIRSFDAIVTEVSWFGDRAARVTVRVDSPVDFQPGQYFEWHLPQVGAPRSYSPANAPGSCTLEFLVRVHDGGGVSGLLRRGELGAGDVLTLKGSFGSYELDANDPRPLVLLAGGTGLAPVKCIAEQLVAQGSRRPLKIYFGARDRFELGYADPLRALAQATPHIEFTAVLSDDPQPSTWAGPRGLVVDVAEATLGDIFGAQAYLCGPPPMVQAAQTVLERLGVMRSDIHCDKFTPAGVHGA